MTSDFAWPHGKRIAVLVTVLLENWSDRAAPSYSPMTTPLKPGTYDRAGVTWSQYGGGVEYGFYANVNPEVDHPRWSQAKERRIGEVFRRPTLMFNGYADQVSKLYAGMDLRKFY